MSGVDIVYEIFNKDKDMRIKWEDELLIQLAIYHKQYDLVKLLINDPLLNLDGCYKKLPTYDAVQFGDLEMLKLLLTKYQCTDDLLESADYEISKYLLEEQQVDPNNSIAFFLATQNDKLDIVKLLLEYQLSDYNINYGLFTAKKRSYDDIVKVIKTHLKK